MKMFLVSWQVFPFDVLVCLGVSREAILRKLTRMSFLMDDEEKARLVMKGQGKTLMLRGGQTILWTKHYPYPGSGVLAHEIFHAVSALLDRLYLPRDYESDELPAYMIEYLTNQITSRLIARK